MLIEKTVTILNISRQCVQIEFVEEIVELVAAGILHHRFHIRSPKTKEWKGED